MQFRFWLENDEYEKFRDGIEDAGRGRDFPFASWFPDASGRVYLPLHPAEGAERQGHDKDIADILQEAGYTIKDYRAGLAVDARGRVVKIGKILAALYQKDSKELAAKQSQYSPIKYQQELRRHESGWKDAIQLFQISAYRSNRSAGDLSGIFVVISSNIHDIGQMTTGRDWTSCMELGKGGHAEDVYREVNRGGFVAYLVRADDKDIRRPLARIAIKRFQNKKTGASIAIPEDTVYGNDIDGFHDAVKRWIDSKQGKVGAGLYRRQGGKWSDSFANYHIHAGVLKLLKFGIGDGRFNSRRRPYIDAAMKKITSPNANFSPRVLKKVVELIRAQSNLINADEFALKYPEYIDKQIYDSMPEYRKDQFDKINPRFVPDRVKKAYDLLDGGLNLDNPALELNKELEYRNLGKIHDLLNQFRNIKPIPERLIVQLIKFGRDLMGRFDINASDPMRSAIGAVVHTLSISGADTPIVVRFYHDLLPYFDQIGIQYMGYAFSRLAISGSPFLPFLREKLKEKEAEIVNAYSTEFRDKQADQIRYVIDAIENGTGRSDRYTFF